MKLVHLRSTEPQATGTLKPEGGFSANCATAASKTTTLAAATRFKTSAVQLHQTGIFCKTHIFHTGTTPPTRLCRIKFRIGVGSLAARALQPRHHNAQRIMKQNNNSGDGK